MMDLFSGVSTVLLVVWTSTVGIIVCAVVFGFFVNAFGPTAAECAFIISGGEKFNFAHGYSLIAMGTGWILGAPAAGQSRVKVHNVYSKYR